MRDLLSSRILAATFVIAVCRQVSADPGLHVAGESPDDVARFSAMVQAAVRASPTARDLVAEITADPDPRHAIEVVVVRDRRAVFVDSLAQGFVDIEDLERFPSCADRDLERNEITREEQIVHLLAERRHLQRALARNHRRPGPPAQALVATAHEVGMWMQNRYREARGQVAVVDAIYHDVEGSPGVGIIEFTLADGTLSVVLTSRYGQMVRIVPPFRPDPGRVRIAGTFDPHRMNAQ